MRFSRKPSILRIAALLICILLILMAGGSNIQAADNHQFGSIFLYNGVIFNEFTGNQADTEGRLAVGGKAALGSPGQSFDVGGAANQIQYIETVIIGDLFVPNGAVPSLVLGSSFAVEGTHCTVFGGPIYLHEDSIDNYALYASKLDTSYPPEFYWSVVMDSFFSGARRTITNMSNNLAAAGKGSISYGTFKAMSSSDLVGALNNGLGMSESIAVINVESGDTLDIGEIRFPSFDGYDMVAININASTVTFDSSAILYMGKQIDTSSPIAYQDSDFNTIASKLLWNFPNATLIECNGKGIIGSIFAPNATFEGNGGSLNGQLFCENLTQSTGFELHNFSLGMGGKIPDDEEPGDGSSPEGGSSEEESSREESSQSESSHDESSKEESSQEESSKDEDSGSEGSKEASSGKESSSSSKSASSKGGSSGTPERESSRSTPSTQSASSSSQEASVANSGVLGSEGNPETGLPLGMALVVGLGMVCAVIGVLFLRKKED